MCFVCACACVFMCTLSSHPFWTPVCTFRCASWVHPPGDNTCQEEGQRRIIICFIHRDHTGGRRSIQDHDFNLHRPSCGVLALGSSREGGSTSPFPSASFLELDFGYMYHSQKLSLFHSYSRCYARKSPSPPGMRIARLP
ncbi:unnamed protein product, partial [Pylaiella littoralis]